MTALSFVWVHPYSQISGCDTTKVVQIDSEQPILAILQLFQYFLTKVVQIDSEWPILAVLLLFQYFVPN